MDSRIKDLLWFLFQPEVSPGSEQHDSIPHCLYRTPDTGHRFRETLKSTVWVALSVLLSLILAYLN